MISEEKRKEILEYLGYEYSEAGIRKLQSDYMLRKKDADGVWGRDTENTALTVYYTKKHTKNFNAKEFRCDCGGRHCCGYPDYMKPEELAHIQTIRDHYGRPITVTSGLRCKGRNSELRGSAENSGHMTGYAIDFYQAGVTDTLKNRKASIEYMRSLPNHKFSYGKDMKGTDGIYRSASYMGNAMHTECKPGTVEPQKKTEPKKDTTPSKLTVDGIAGVATIKAAQRRYGTVVDGYITGQRDDLKKYYPNIIAVKAGKGGSALVRAIQQWTRTTVDGIWGKGTTLALQKKLKELGYYTGELDGIAGKETVTAWQHYLNGDEPKKTEPKKEEPKTSDTVIDVSDFQDTINWDKVKAAGIMGAIVKCGYRGAETPRLVQDKRFIEHITGAYKAGLKVGVYFFTEAVNAQEGKEEAEYTLKLIRDLGLPLSFPVGVDSENVTWKNPDGTKGYGRANDKNLSASKRTEAIKAFCETVESAGYKSMIYASTSWLNNQLKMSELPFYVWCAQYYSKCEYKGDYVMWQYTSDGSVPGIKGDVDMNHCYLKDTTPTDPPKDPEKEPVIIKKEVPSLHLVKTREQVIADAILWAKWIAGYNVFHYGKKPNSQHNGCYFCGTNTLKGGRAKTGVLDYEHSYCCNPFVHAALAHGGCIPKALQICESGSSWDYHTGKGYDASSLFEKMGNIPISKLKKGDVLCRDNHVMLYIGNGKIAHAHGGDDNKRNSESWNNSISINELKKSQYTRVYRLKGGVDATLCIRHGEISDRVAVLQAYLGLTADRIFGDGTFKALKEWQKAHGLVDDGIAGELTIKAMEAAA